MCGRFGDGAGIEVDHLVVAQDEVAKHRGRLEQEVAELLRPPIGALRAPKGSDLQAQNKWLFFLRRTSCARRFRPPQAQNFFLGALCAPESSDLQAQNFFFGALRAPTQPNQFIVHYAICG